MHDEVPAFKTANDGAPMHPTPPPSSEVRRAGEPPESTDNQLRSNVWKFGGIWQIVITLINGIGWLIMYFLVLSPQVDQYRAQTKLFNVQSEKLESVHQKLVEQLEVQEKSGRVQLDDTNRRLIELQISRLEGATARLEGQLAALRAQTQATADLNSVRQSLRPNVVFGRFVSTISRKDEIELEQEIKNIGSNAAIVEAPRVRLSMRPITEETTRDALLVANRDYSLRVLRPGMFQPGSAGRSLYSIKLLNQALRGSAIYYEFGFQVSTDPLAVSTAAQILGKQISDADLNKLSQFNYGFVGTVTFPP